MIPTCSGYSLKPYEPRRCIRRIQPTVEGLFFLQPTPSIFAISSTQPVQLIIIQSRAYVSVHGLKVLALLKFSDSLVMVQGCNPCVVCVSDVLQVDFIEHQKPVLLDVGRNQLNSRLVSRPH